MLSRRTTLRAISAIFCPELRKNQIHGEHKLAHAATVVTLADPPVLARRGAGRAAGGIHPHAAPRHRPAARAGLSGAGQPGRGRRLPAGAWRHTAPAGARRRGGGSTRRGSAGRRPGLGRRHCRVVGARAGQGDPGDAAPIAPAGGGAADDDGVPRGGVALRRRPTRRRWSPSRKRAGTPSAWSSPTPPPTATAPSATSSRCGWCPWAAAGTWSPTTSPGTTGAASGWTAWVTPGVPAPGSAPGSCPPRTRPRSSGRACAPCRPHTPSKCAWPPTPTRYAARSAGGPPSRTPATGGACCG